MVHKLLIWIPVLLNATIMTRGTNLSKWVNQVAKQPVLVPNFDTYYTNTNKQRKHKHILYVTAIHALSNMHTL